MIKKLKRDKIILVMALIIVLVAEVIFGIKDINQAEEYDFEIKRLEAQLQDRQEQIDILEIIIENQKTEPEVIDEPEYIGTFTVTHYCPCKECCGKSDGITFTGVQAQEGRTIAVDPEVIPLGSTVIIDGQEYVAEDIGGAIKGNRIDKFMDSHQASLNAGMVQADVYIGG